MLWCCGGILISILKPTTQSLLQTHHNRPPPSLIMSNFHLTAELNSIRVENGHMLHARIIQADGDHVHSEFDLNRCIGNQDGTYMDTYNLKPEASGHDQANTYNRTLCMGWSEYD